MPGSGLSETIRLPLRARFAILGDHHAPSKYFPVHANGDFDCFRRGVTRLEVQDSTVLSAGNAANCSQFNFEGFWQFPANSSLSAHHMIFYPPQPCNNVKILLEHVSLCLCKSYSKGPIRDRCTISYEVIIVASLTLHKTESSYSGRDHHEVQIQLVARRRRKVEPSSSRW